MLVVVIGPPLGGWLAGQYGFKIMLITAGCLYTLATILRVGMARVASRTHEANPEKLSAQSLKIKLSAMTGMVLAGGVLTWILITDGVRDVAFSMSFTLMPIYLEETGGLSVSQIGWLSSIFGIFMMITSTPSGWLADKKGERVSIVSGFILVFIALILFINLSGFWSYALVWAIFGVGVGMMSPAYNSLISKAVPEKLRGTAFGLLQSSLGLFSLPAPAIGAQLWTRIGPSFPFSLTAWVSLITIIPAWLKFKLPSKKDTIETETLIE